MVANIQNLTEQKDGVALAAPLSRLILHITSITSHYLWASNVEALLNELCIAPGKHFALFKPKVLTEQPIGCHHLVQRAARKTIRFSKAPWLSCSVVTGTRVLVQAPTPTSELLASREVSECKLTDVPQ